MSMQAYQGQCNPVLIPRQIKALFPLKKGNT